MLSRLFIAFGGLVVVALFAALLAPLFVNWTDFRHQFEDQASRILGKKVVVHGSLEARLLPFPSVTMNDVTVGPGEDGKTLAHVARFSMDVELAPFLSGEARIFAMRIEKPRVRLRVLPNGSLDWLLGSRPSLPARNVVLENVTVSDGVIDVIDEQTGRNRIVQNLNANLKAGSLAGPWTVSGSAALDGQMGRFSLSTLQPEAGRAVIPLKIHLVPAATPVDIDLSGDLDMADQHPTLKGTFVASIRSAQLSGEAGKKSRNEAILPEPRVRGKFELANDRLRVPEYRLEVGALDQPYVITGEATLDSGKAPEFLLTAEGQQIDVDRLTMPVTAGKTARMVESSARQRIRALIALADQIPIPDVPGRASVKLPAIVAGDTVLRDITLNLRPAGRGWTVEKAVATLPGRTQVEASGRLQLKGAASFAGSLLIASNQPSGLASWLSGNVDPAIRTLRAVGLSANVNLTADVQQFDKLELAIGSASLRGRLERHSGDNVEPSLSFDVAGDAFDYDAVKALASLVSGDASGDSLLNQQISGKIKVGAFSALGVTAQDVDGLFTYDNGGFSIRKLDIGNLAGASIKATGEASGSLADYNGKAQVVLNASNMARFLAMLQQQLPVHPLLNRLANSGDWYGNSNLVLDARFGDAQYGGVQLDLHGQSNGTKLSVALRQSSLFDVFGDAQKTLSVHADNADPSILLGQLGFQPLSIPMDGAASLNLELKEEGDAPATGKLNLNAGATHLVADGTVNLDSAIFLEGKGNVTLASDDIAPLMMMNAVSLPGIVDGLPVSLSAKVEHKGQKTVLSVLTGQIAGDAIGANLTLEPTNDAFKLAGDVKLERANLNWLASSMIGPMHDALKGGFSTEKLSSPIWGQMQMALDVHADSLGLASLPDARNFAAKLTLLDGGMTLENASADWLGGKADMRLLLSNNQDTAFLRSKLTLKGSQLAAIWPDSSLRGNADVDFTAEGSGKNAKELMSSVNGSGRIALSSLVLPKLDLNSLPALSAAFESAKGEVTAAQVADVLKPLLARAPADLGEVASAFTLTEGKMRVQGLKAQTPKADLSAEAVVDVPDATLNGALTVAFHADDAVGAGSTPTVRVLLDGPVNSPVITLDANEMASYLSMQAFERERRRVETLQSNVLEKQRLRREVAYYTALAEARQAAKDKAELERRKAAEAARSKLNFDGALPPAPHDPVGNLIQQQSGSGAN
ncbi:AsmA-like protein [Agrobacterium vitis]|nr:AsmA-like protein [Agrobacterium vitis]